MWRLELQPLKFVLMSLPTLKRFIYLYFIHLSVFAYVYTCVQCVAYVYAYIQYVFLLPAKSKRGYWDFLKLELQLCHELLCGTGN